MSRTDGQWGQLIIDKKAKRDAAATARALRRPAKPKHEMKVANFVTSARIIRQGKEFSSEFHFPTMADLLGGSYAERGFECVTLHPRQPKLCMHLYRSGVIIVCGAKSELDAEAGMHLVMTRIRKAWGWILLLVNYHVSNVVAHRNLGYHLNLWSMWEDGKAEYHPALFPGLCYYPNGFSVERPCVIVQSSGAIVVVGAPDFETACAVDRAIPWHKYKLIK